MFCENCGSQMAEGTKFCIACGAKAEMKDTAQAATVQETAASVENTAPVTPAAAPVVVAAPSPQPVPQKTVTAQPIQQTAQPVQAAQPKPVQPINTQPAQNQPLQKPAPAQPHNYAPVQQPNYANTPNQAASQSVIAQRPEKIAPLPVWKYIGIFILTGIPVIGFIMLLVWSFGDSCNKNTKNFAKAVLIMMVVMIILTAVGYFTLWSSITDIFSNYNLSLS